MPTYILYSTVQCRTDMAAAVGCVRPSLLALPALLLLLLLLLLLRRLPLMLILYSTQYYCMYCT